MGDVTYSRLYPNEQSDGYPETQKRRSMGPMGYTTPGSQDSRKAAFNVNVYTRETATELYDMPLDVRFARVHQMLSRADVRDVQEIFQPAVEAVFGFRGSSTAARTALGVPMGQMNQQDSVYIPVSFCDITTDYRIVYEAGYALLNTDGPLMKFLTAVSSSSRGGNSWPKFEFPVSCLPYAVQNSMENGMVPPFYRDKVASPVGDYDPPEYITLSALDFFFAHFAYHLVNPDIRTSNPAHPQCLYMALIDNYGQVFFDANTIVENQRILSSQHSSSGFPRRSQQFLFGASRTLNMDSQNGGQTEQRSQPHALATPENLESLISIFVEFWLNMSGFSSQRFGRKYHSSSTYGSDRPRQSSVFGHQSPLYSPSSKRHLSATLNMPTVFPPVCALQGFRQVVKAVHEFIYAPAVNPRNQKNHETSLLDMKRHIVPQLIQKPLYDLLKTTMKKYPMDASFRFVYELWLTYIQPWRYDSPTGESTGESTVLLNKEQRWINFVTENLLFYGTVFQAFVDRMLRVDFGVPFNTLALFRVAKVFREADLYKLVLNVEPFAQKSSSASSGLSPSKTTVRNHFADLEGDSSFKYISFTSADSVVKVTALLRTLMAELRRCQRKRQEQANPVSSMTRSSGGYWKKFFTDALKSVFGLLNRPIEGMQLRPDELERMSKHMTDAVDYLCLMFQIDETEISESEVAAKMASHANEFLLDHEPSFRAVEASAHGIARSRSQIRPRHSIPSWLDESKVPYLTEPEKRLPRSWEIEFLIPLLNACSFKINSDYGAQIVELYNGRDFVSRLVRPLIEPPHYPAVLHGGEPSGRPSLPARINLRPLASKYLLGSLLFFWFFIWIFDFGVIRGVFWMVALPAFFLLANALLEPLRGEAHDDRH